MSIPVEARRAHTARYQVVFQPFFVAAPELAGTIRHGEFFQSNRLLVDLDDFGEGSNMASSATAATIKSDFLADNIFSHRTPPVDSLFYQN